MRRDGTGLGQNHAAFHLFLLRAAQQNTTLSPALAESRSLRNISMSVAAVLRGVFQADDFDFFHFLEHAALDTAGHDRAATSMLKTSSTHIRNGLSASRVGTKSKRPPRPAIPEWPSGLQAYRPKPPCAAANNGRLVAGKTILCQQVADFHFHEVSNSLSSTRSILFRKTTIASNADLACEQNVFARLGHRAVRRADDEIAPSICAAPVIMFLT